MSILVVNCFGWVGYHITIELLEAGYLVDGLDQMSTKKHDHLSMFIGRNSSFSFKDEEHTGSYKYCIMVGSKPHITHLGAGRIFHISDAPKKASALKHTMTIEIPMLFGEWMPMNDKGIYYQGTFIPFNSSKFLLEAVYIKDFTRSLLQWINTSYMSHMVKVKSVRNKGESDLKLENTIFLRDNRPIQKNIQYVISHYHRFKEYYEL